MKRRQFIGGILATPFLGNAKLLMPVKTVVPYLPGDLVNFHINTYIETGILARCQSVKRIEGQYVITTSPSFRKGEELRVPSRLVSLFHGLPGNRVNNPSMKHRLIKDAGRIGYYYEEDR